MEFTHSINICEERTSKGTIRRLNHDELSFFPYETKILQALPLRMQRINFMRINSNMSSSNTFCDRAGIRQALHRSTIQPGNRYNEAVADILWPHRHIAALLAQRNVGNKNLWPEVQRSLQSKNHWIRDQASQGRGCRGFGQNNCNGIFRILPLYIVNVIKQCPHGRTM